LRHSGGHLIAHVIAPAIHRLYVARSDGLRPVRRSANGKSRQVLYRVCKLAKHPNDLLSVVGLWQETSALGKVILSNIHKPGSGYDLDGGQRPPIAIANFNPSMEPGI
jgi:hypothetical protein